MAKATIAVAVLALAMLLTGPVAAVQSRRLLQAQASGSGNGGGTGDVNYGQSFDNSGTFSNLFSSGGAAGGASYGVSITNGEPSITTAFGEGTTLSIDGQSHSQAQTEAFNNGNPGSFAGQTIHVGSENLGAATDALSSAEALGRK